MSNGQRLQREPRAECSEVMQTRIAYTHFSAHQSLRNFQKRLKSEFPYVFCDVFNQKNKTKKYPPKTKTNNKRESNVGQSPY